MRKSLLIIPALLVGLFAQSFFFQSVSAQNSTDYEKCVPKVHSFKVSPTKLTKRDQNITLTAVVRTEGCIIDVVGNQWQVRAEYVDDNGSYYGDQSHYRIPFASEFIRPSDFKRVNNNVQSPDYNKYDATYTSSVTSPFLKQSGTTLALRANMFWGTTRYAENVNSTIKMTAPELKPGEGGGDKDGGGVNSDIEVKNTVNLDNPVGTLFNPLNDNLTRPEAILLRIVNLLLMFAGIVAVIFIIIGGFLMATSAGNASRLGQGKKTLIYAIAGLILTLLSFTIVAIIQSIIS